MNILLFGAPGSGKGTQSAQLVQDLGMAHISTGDVLRDEIKRGTALGQEAKRYMDKGELVPDQTVIGMVETALKGLGGCDFILDGFPRTVVQAEALKSMLMKNHMNLDRAIFLEVPKDELVRRLTGRRVCSKCGTVYHMIWKPTRVDGVCDNCGSPLTHRADDQADVVITRLETYLKNTSPLKDYYRKTGQFVEVAGMGDMSEVQGKVRAAMA